MTMKFGTRLEPECQWLVPPDETRHRIAQNVMAALKAKQKSWSWLARQLGVHRGRMTKIFTMDQLINVNTFANIAIVVGMSMDDLHRPITKIRKKKLAAS